jgi:hypothetical protein
MSLPSTLSASPHCFFCGQYYSGGMQKNVPAQFQKDSEHPSSRSAVQRQNVLFLFFFTLDTSWLFPDNPRITLFLFLRSLPGAIAFNLNKEVS